MSRRRTRNRFALLAVTVINLLVDASYAYLNPKVRGL